MGKNTGTSKKDPALNSMKEALQYIHANITSVNQSKVFAGLIIIVLNISSKFITIKLSKSVESYLKYTFSRNVLIFSMAWMGTRDIYIALFITMLFILAADYLFNEDSKYNILSEQFKTQHTKIAEQMETISDQQIAEAKTILERAEKQKEEESRESMQNMKSTKVDPLANVKPYM
jgi:hypothetical protein